MPNEDKVFVYPEIFEIARKNAQNPNFAIQGGVSAYSAIKPYYGTDAVVEFQKAIEYAKKLSEQKSSPVTIDPKYYQELKKAVPLAIGGELAGQVAPHYSPAQGRMPEYVSMPNIQQYQKYKEETGKNPIKAAESNYGYWALGKDEIQKNLIDYYRNTLEHEATHIPDKNITFAAPPPVTIGTHDVASARKDLGYMAQEHHLAVGLGKIQREHYALTGKRIESPEEFKQFLFSLVNSRIPVEDSISQFSEEARRALRPQIENAKNVFDYERQLNRWKENDSLFKGPPPKIIGNPDLLEKSAHLIPALVNVGRQKQNQTG